MAKISVSVTVDNSAKVQAEIKSAIARALWRIGAQAEGYAKDLCPVGTPESTGIPGYVGGTLRGSITHTSDGKAAYIGTDVKYGKYVELGTVKMAARPFLRPAAANHADTYRNIVKDELGG